MPNIEREVVVYRGEDIIATGTYRECAEALGVLPATIAFYTTPTYQRRLAKRKDHGRRIAVVKTNDEPDTLADFKEYMAQPVWPEEAE